MVKKYVILAYSNDETFDIPRQLVEIDGEPILKRTIRLLKENGIEDITVTGKDKRYKNLGVKVYQSKNNDFDYIKRTGYWLNAFDYDLMDEPVCFIWGDVYFSEEAIKTIVETETDENLFFCSYNNKCSKYIKHHDEPFAYKIVDTDLFKKHIDLVKKLFDEGKTCRHPIVWEVYRSMNGLDINEHVMTNNYVAINDITCDIDSAEDVDKIKEKLGGEIMIKLQALENFTLERFNEIQDIERAGKEQKNWINKNDIFKCSKDLADYLLGENPLNRPVVKVIEVEPEELPIGKSVYDEKDVVKDIANKTLEKVKQEKIPKKKKSSKK